MRLGLRMVISILRQGRTLLALAAVVAVVSICMFGCVGGSPALTSGYSEIVPGTVPVDTFLVDDTYKAVKIGGVTWMAKNLNIENGNSWCLTPLQCAMFGRLYDWNTAKDICPPGWHLPSRQEWVDLEAMAGGSKLAGKRLKSSAQWDGTNDYGFSAVPAGMRIYDDGSAKVVNCCMSVLNKEGEKFAVNCNGRGEAVCRSFWWTSEEYDVTGMDCGGRPCEGRAYVAADENFGNGGSLPKRAGLSVRCILND